VPRFPFCQLADKLEISSPTVSSAIRTLEDTERGQILKILTETKWRIEGKDGAAAILGIHPSTLRARLHKLEIVRPENKRVKTRQNTEGRSQKIEGGSILYSGFCILTSAF